MAAKTVDLEDPTFVEIENKKGETSPWAFIIGIVVFVNACTYAIVPDWYLISLIMKMFTLSASGLLAIRDYPNGDNGFRSLFIEWGKCFLCLEPILCAAAVVLNSARG
jgi:hypothetical protein